jgi:hypothetical protein
MSESETLQYIRAELQVLQPILGELISVFWTALVEQWEREGCPGISPLAPKGGLARRIPIAPQSRHSHRRA